VAWLMSLATRIIPTILSKNGHLVKGIGFKADRICGNSLQAARVHAMRSVDELVILDVGDGEPDYEMIRKLTDNCFTPVTVGGGIKSKRVVKELLANGADKVCVHWRQVRNFRARGMANKFGSQCITAAIDVGEDLQDYMFWVETAQNHGVGEILLQSVERDGTMQGYDLGLIKAVSESVSIPVIASGGCSGYNNMVEAVKAGASAVAVGALFLFTSATPKGASEYLNEAGIEAR